MSVAIHHNLSIVRRHRGPDPYNVDPGCTEGDVRGEEPEGLRAELQLDAGSAAGDADNEASGEHQAETPKRSPKTRLPRENPDRAKSRQDAVKIAAAVSAYSWYARD